jgi:hypothetical protein
MSSVAIVYVTLFLISLFYNHLVAWMEKEGLLNGYMAILAVGGVGYTILLLAFILPAETTLLISGAFIAALAPMVWGDMRRYFKARKDWQEFWGKVKEKMGLKARDEE